MKVMLVQNWGKNYGWWKKQDFLEYHAWKGIIRKLNNVYQSKTNRLLIWMLFILPWFY